MSQLNELQEELTSDDFPALWVKTKLGNLVRLQSGYAFKSKEYSSIGIPILRMGNIQKDFKLNFDKKTQPCFPLDRISEVETYLLQGGDIVITLTDLSDTGKYLGTVARLPENFRALLNQRVAKIVYGEYVDPTFIFYSLQQPRFRNYMEGDTTGTLQKNTNHAYVESFSFFLPPFNEQRRIVEKIEALTARSRKARAALDEIPALLDQFRQSVLAAAFRGNLTADWRAQNPNVEPAEALLERIRIEREGKATSTRDKSRLHKDWEELEAPSISKSLDTWLKCSIGHIGNVCNGSTPSRKEDDYWGGSIPWVSSGEVQNNIIFSTREKITEAGFKNSSGRILPVETVLIAMIGEGKTRGQTAILKIQSTINQNIAAIVLDHGLLSSQYLWHWFRYKYSETRRAGSGSGPQALNCQRVREMPFILPPLAEQKVIVERIDSLLGLTKNLEAQHQTTQEDLGQLDQSILAKAFRGELVTQDPNDEPAAVLLDRIRAERERLGSGKKRGKAKA